MVTSLERIVIPARFIITVGHLLSTILVSKSTCCGCNVNDNGLYNDKEPIRVDEILSPNTGVKTTLFITLIFICFFINFLALAVGHSISMNFLHWCHIIMHSIGSSLMSGCMVWLWHPEFETIHAIRKVSGSMTIATAIFEVVAFIHFFKGIRYKFSRV
jgi:hypothetical protein